MKAFSPFLPQPVADGIQYRFISARLLQGPMGAAVEVAEIDAGNKPLLQLAETQHLLQIPQLIDLAHGFRADMDVGKPRLVQHPLGLQQGASGLGGGFRTAEAPQAAGMNHDAAPAHPTHRQGAVVDIPQTVQPLLLIGGGQRDIIGRMEGESDAVGLRLPFDRRGGFLRNPDAPAALIFEGVQSSSPQPGEHLQGGFVALGME